MFDYQVMTEEEAAKARFQLLDDGDYDAVILKGEHKISSTNNNMIELQVAIYTFDGSHVMIKDYLVFTPGMMWKVLQCVESCGLKEDYENKKLHADKFANLNVRVKIKTQKGREIPYDKLGDRPAGSCYPDKNVIDAYLKRAPQDKGVMMEDDDIPF